MNDEQMLTILLMVGPPPEVPPWPRDLDDEAAWTKRSEGMALYKAWQAMVIEAIRAMRFEPAVRVYPDGLVANRVPVLLQTVREFAEWAQERANELQGL